VQVDFDARVSERAFYRGLLERLHEELSRDVRLSITALASWCLDDPWIRDLPVDEAVPMLFRMGPDRDAVLDYLASGGDFKVDLCRHSAGLSLDEPVYRVPRGRTLYFFSPGRWTPQLIETAANGRFLQ
jgi:hypothetical protein